MIPLVATAASHGLRWKAPTRIRNSPTNPFSPGSPSDDSTTTRNTAEKAGTTRHRPPKSAMSREWRRSVDHAHHQEEGARRQAVVTIWMRAPTSPCWLSVKMPSITKPRWLTLEYATELLHVRLHRRHPGAVDHADHREGPHQGPNARLASGKNGMIYGAWVSTVQPDMKKLVAYSSVSHLGFVMLGIFTLNQQGLVGALIQMVNHGLSTGALFLMVGMIYERRHSRLIADFGGCGAWCPPSRPCSSSSCCRRWGSPAERIRRRVPDPGRRPSSGARGSPRSRTSGIIFAAVYLLWMYSA